ncbi:hypothetical protein TPHA_0C04750 [Tetrapisispora phaffii CBS 4417]|uniref:Bul1 N-terminal domain-containing protein n=1 Tax=Tetrapisispora phaffii (strain ATCC 24235 / CBS 4417 / NBRC 1672 / NRRL Y-8282 / UCD 70-5) TaxID=1071381 RepID=G8BQW2_TETPH|nr:hypothetical protein TPHA_0C04750 [Tetrapisispora phaffii CBS 4417]CCE62624.1 hypothetical protein TPHA_0C04750 [Tetrapisispora phaffii CBS 4417]
MTGQNNVIRPPLRTAHTENVLRGRLPANSSSSNLRTSLSKSKEAKQWIRSASASNLLRSYKSKNNDQSLNNVDGMTPSTGTSTNKESSSSNEGALYLQTNDSNTFVDVLPSFEMYNTLHRHIPQGNVDPDRHDFPPSYQEVQTQRESILPRQDHPELLNLEQQQCSYNRTNITLSSSSNIENVPNGEDIITPLNFSGTNLHSLSSSNLNSLHPLSTQHLNIQPYPTMQHGIASNISSRTSGDPGTDSNTPEDDLNDNDNIFIDKLYTLPKLTTPVEIDIRITKQASFPHEKPEEESILKEYTSGDIIHGYCIIENRSSQPLKFEMFYVTLEAYTSVIDRTKGKRTVKRFLRMVDLSASWSYSNMILSSGVNVVAGDVDYDNSIIGLNNNRVLEPGKKYKKFFMFKLPNQLLDITCKQEQFQHCLLPPSFGIDKYRNNGRYSGIKVNNVLGCGHLGIKGSPILTYDMLDDNLSINYTVDARIVGKDIKTHKLNIMKEQVYNIRVIPFGFSSKISNKKPTEQINELIKLVEERLEALDRIFQKLEKKEPISNSDIRGTEVYGTLEGTANLGSKELLERKIRHMYISNRECSDTGLNSSKDLKNLHPQDKFVESELNYKIKSKPKSSSSLFSTFLGSSQPSSSSTASKTSPTSTKSEKAGLIVLTCDVPKQSLPYWSPSLLRKTNVYENKNSYNQENWNNLQSTIPDDEKDLLSKLDIHLTCIQSNNSMPHDPPDIHSVTTELICITVKSDNSIPVKLEQDLLMNEKKMKTTQSLFSEYVQKIKTYKKKFNENLAELNELYNSSRTFTSSREIKFSDFISGQLHNDIESIANLNISIIQLNDIFKKQVDTLKSQSDSISANSNIHSAGNSSTSVGSLYPSRSGGTNILSATFSGSTQHTSSKASTQSRMKDQLTHDWVQCKQLQYERELSVNIEYAPDIKETLIPSFESCLCARFYLVRVYVKFEHHAGVAMIDIPVDVKKLT